MEDISIFAAFGAGLVSFVTPCVLPLVPVYIASLVGPEILDPKTSSRRMPVFLHSLSFVLGFSIVFTLMGALVGWAGIVINPQSLLVQTIEIFHLQTQIPAFPDYQHVESTRGQKSSLKPLFSEWFFGLLS